jgi:hypothetical protein
MARVRSRGLPTWHAVAISGTADAHGRRQEETSRFAPEGHTFAQWRDGDSKCVHGHGKRYHGRKCARAASAEFARIEVDLHNSSRWWAR